ncbi:MAG: DUF2333 family protein, partial [Desulfobacterales bacterium]
MENESLEKSLIPKMTKFGKWAVLILLAFILIWPLSIGLYWTVYKGYTILDPTRFPDLDPNVTAILKKTTSDSTPAQKGVALSAAIRNRLEQEMNSTFGWSINDLIVSPTRWLDNRANRQRGTIFATRMMVNFFSTNLAKYGQVDKENEFLIEAREKHFAFTSDKWWFPSSESQYEKGIALLKEYESELLRENSEAVFNLRTDDMHNMLEF